MNKITLILFPFVIGCGQPEPRNPEEQGKSRKPQPSLNKEGPVKPPEKPVGPRVRLSETDPGEMLRWLIKVSEGPRAVELNGNELAYENALEAMSTRMKDLYGHKVTWSLKVLKVERAGIRVWPEVAYQTPANPPVFALRA